MNERPAVRLCLNAYENLLPVATGFVERSALAFGLGRQESLALTLATEEVFLYLCHISSPGTDVEIQCRFTGYCLETTFDFEAAGFPLRAFNLTGLPSFEDEAASRETGIMIASRLLDRFHVEHVGPRLRLTFVKDRAYPAADGRDAPVGIPVTQYIVRRPDPEELKTSARMIIADARIRFYPLVARFPGKVADIFMAGHLEGALAVNEAGQIGGILLWTGHRRRTVDCFGPYIFHPDSDPEMAGRLLDRCLEEIARTGAPGLINRFPGTGLPSGYFEVIGSLDFYTEDGIRAEVEASYRQLEEDRGAVVWAHPDLVPFLEARYRGLTLPREIHRVTAEGEGTDTSTVFFVEMDRPQHWAVLHPVTFAGDAEETLRDHVRLLHKERFRTLFFELDTGNPRDAHFIPALLKNGFEPRLLIPHGRKGDLVLFQHGTHGLP